jgi:hypothetical protein
MRFDYSRGKLRVTRGRVFGEGQAASLAKLYDYHFQPGAVFNICAGPTRSVLVGTLIDGAFECFGCTRRPTRGSLDEFEIYARSLVKNGAREVIKALLTAFSYFLPISPSIKSSRTTRPRSCSPRLASVFPTIHSSDGSSATAPNHLGADTIGGHTNRFAPRGSIQPCGFGFRTPDSTLARRLCC